MLTRKETFILALRELFQKKGYSHFRMAKFEEYDFYADKKDFLPSRHILTFTDADGRLMALRPDVTLSLIKRAGKGKYYYAENVYRVPRHGSSFREISQTGAEIIGDIQNGDLREILSTALASLEILAGGKDKRNFVLTVADARQILECDEVQSNPEIIRLIEQKNIHGLKKLNASRKLLQLCELDGSTENALPLLRHDCREIIKSIPNEHLRIDFSVVRGENIRYYNGIVFNGYIEGVPERVISGGMYNIMNVCGAGFAVYLDEMERVMNNDKDSIS